MKLRAFVLLIGAAVVVGSLVGALLGLSDVLSRPRSAEENATPTAVSTAPAMPGASRPEPRHTRTPTPTREPAKTPSASKSSTWVREASLRREVAGVAARTGASVGVAVRPLGRGPALSIGPLQRSPAWSTIKVPLTLARYRLGGGGRVNQLAAAALQSSDNAAAQQMFDEMAAALGGVPAASARIQKALHDAGDNRTIVNIRRPAGDFSTYGQTQWALVDGTLFFRALARRCLVPRAAAARIWALMGDVVEDQKWGLGRAHFEGGGRIRLKGGWGPGPDGRYLVRQFGVVEAAGGRGFVVAVAAQAADGSFEGGIAAVEALSDAVSEWTNAAASPVGGAC